MSGTIAAIATPLAPGGVAMIRISGAEALSAAAKVFVPAGQKTVEEMSGYTAAYGTICRPDGERVDDGVLTVYRAPKSYTGEDVAEITCHGGIAVTREILRLVTAGDVSLAGPGEFSKRAFLHGKMSLTQAESIMDLIGAESTQAVRAARAQMDGALYRRTVGIRTRLLEAAGHLAAWADYPEEDIEEIGMEGLAASLDQMLFELTSLNDSFDTGKMLREGIDTVIVGKTNVGKSTLMNLLSGYEKSIVTEIAGTTRDVVEETVRLGDVVLRLADTAGIRETGDIVEQKGVSLSLKRIATASLILAVFDSSAPLDQYDCRMMESVLEAGTPAVAVLNKSDLPSRAEKAEIAKHFKHIVYTSNKNTDSIQLLADEISALTGLENLDTQGGMLVNERQRRCALDAARHLQEAREALAVGMTLDAVTISLEESIHALLELTGERVTDQIVDQVFHNFCVGK